MYDEPTPEELYELAALEEAALIRAHSPTFWDADAAELQMDPNAGDPWTHPSWEVASALTGTAWDDPEEAVEIRELLVEERRTLDPDSTPTNRTVSRPVDEALVDPLTPEEELHENLGDHFPSLFSPAIADVWEVRAA